MRLFYALIMTFFVCGLLHARGVEKTAEPSEVLRALDFFESEGNIDAVDKVSRQSLSENPSDWPLVQRVLEVEVKKKNRPALWNLMQKLLSLNSCPAARSTNKGKEICRRLRTLWAESLMDLFFFEASAGRLQNARRLVREKNCAEALTTLRELESREGLLQSLSEVYVDTHKCLGDTEAAAKVASRAERWKQLEEAEE